MRCVLFVLSAALLGSGCYQGYQTDSVSSESQAVPPGPLDEQPDARIQATARQATFTQLTRNAWTTEVLSEHYPDRTIFRFHADGTYRIDYLTDYTAAPGKGMWNFLHDDDGTWWLIFDNGQRQRFHFNGDQSFLFLGNRLQPDEPLEQTRRWDQLLPVSIPESVEKVVDHLCVNPWQLSNDLNLYSQPTSVEFHPDWTYRSTYRKGECHN